MTAPWIRQTEKTGYPKAVSWPRCPVCGEECETIYISDGEPVGCDECLETVDAWEYQKN